MPNKKKQLVIELAVILLTETIIQRSGKFNLSSTLTQLIITEHNINKHLCYIKHKHYIVTNNKIT